MDDRRADLLKVNNTYREIYGADTVETTDADIHASGFSSASEIQWSDEIFVVHGHDGQAKAELQLFLQRARLRPIVLHEQPNGGRAA